MDSQRTELNSGETAINNAPRLTLRNGNRCIPQHYLRYMHTRASVEALISDIRFCEKYPIFVSEDAAGLILQIGIIGYDNYKSADKQPGPKIVFGRKWRIEPNLPSSEIIQTAFLAVKKAREHEIRELFTLKIKGKTTTPFNNHHDLPLMARNSDVFKDKSNNHSNPKDSLKVIRYDGGKFYLTDCETLRNGFTALTLSFVPKRGQDHQELTERPIILLLESVTENALYHALISEIITLSDRYVDETFFYKGFARFSWNNDTLAIAELSAELRQNPRQFLKTSQKACNFVKEFVTERYETDITRIPQLTDSAYSKIVYKRLSAMGLANIDMLQNAKCQS